MEAHEELAEIFLTVAAIVAAVAAAPLTAGIVGRAARALIAVDLASVQRAGSDPEAWRATVIDL